MKRSVLILMNVLIISSIFIFGAGAFFRGENRIGNSTFEDDFVGDLPLKWGIESGG
jgi:hypothetical protein